MVCENVKTMGGPRFNPVSTREKVYGYLDQFRYVSESCPLKTYQLTLNQVVIGRESDCQIQIKNSRVSRQQCVILIAFDNQCNLEVRLKNLTSKLTTVYKNIKMASGEEVVLKHGDRFRLYDVELRYRLYDPVNEKGELDWTRPIPVVRISTALQMHDLDQLKLTKVKTVDASKEPPAQVNFHNLSYRRQSLPLSLGLKNNRDASSTLYLKVTRRNSTPAEISQVKLTEREIAHNNYNKKAMALVASNAYKRRGSSDFDMRKAVLQRSFRRAFRERINQGSFEDVDDYRLRKALEDFVVLSSAA